MNITQENFDKLVSAQDKLAESLNHRMTSVESNVTKITTDIVWMKRIGYYMAGIVTTIAIKLML